MPVFNGEKYIGQAIKSLLRQSYMRFVLLISDNASTDSTPAICRAFADSDPRIHYVRQAENVGATANFVSVLQMAESDYFMWAAYDDLWSRDWLDNAVSTLESNPNAIFALGKVVLKSINYRLWQTVPVDRFRFVEDESREKRVLRYVNRHIYSHKTNMVYSLMRLPILREAVSKAGFLDADLLCAALLWLGPGATMSGGKFFKRYPKKWPAMFINRRINPEKLAAFESAREERFRRMKVLFPEIASELEVIRANYRPRHFGRDFRIVDDGSLADGD